MKYTMIEWGTSYKGGGSPMKSSERNKARAAAEARDKQRKRERELKKGVVTAKNSASAKKNGK